MAPYDDDVIPDHLLLEVLEAELERRGIRHLARDRQLLTPTFQGRVRERLRWISSLLRR